jgi:hypothetical protein
MLAGGWNYALVSHARIKCVALTYIVAFDIVESIALGEKLGNGAFTATRRPGNDEDVVLGSYGHVGGRLGNIGRFGGICRGCRG